MLLLLLSFSSHSSLSLLSSCQCRAGWWWWWCHGCHLCHGHRCPPCHCHCVAVALAIGVKSLSLSLSCRRWVVFKSPVRSGLFAFFGGDRTTTGCGDFRFSLDRNRTDGNRLCTVARSGCNRFKPVFHTLCISDYYYELCADFFRVTGLQWSHQCHQMSHIHLSHSLGTRTC